MEYGKFGKLGSSYPESGVPDVVYEVPITCKGTEVNVNIVNTSLTAVKVWMYITDKETPEQIDSFEFGTPMSPSTVIVRNREKCSPGEKIVFISSPKGAVMRVSGLEGNIGG